MSTIRLVLPDVSPCTRINNLQTDWIPNIQSVCVNPITVYTDGLKCAPVLLNTSRSSLHQPPSDCESRKQMRECHIQRWKRYIRGAIQRNSSQCHCHLLFWGNNRVVASAVQILGILGITIIPKEEMWREKVQGDPSGCSLGLVDIKQMLYFSVCSSTRTQLLFWCQQHLGNNLMGHPVMNSASD